MESNKIPDTILAYLAGMIDGDGYITVQRSVRGRAVYFGPAIGIAGTRREPHDLAASLFGGKVTEYKPKNPKHRPQFQWSRIGAKAVEIIELIEPYLLIKAEHAGVALLLWEHLQDGKSPDPYPWFGPSYNPDVHSNEYRLQMIELNQSRNRISSRTTLELLKIKVGI